MSRKLMNRLVSTVSHLRFRPFSLPGSGTTPRVLRWGNRITMLLIVVLVVYISHDLMTFEPQVEVVQRPTREERVLEKTAEEGRPYDFYAQEIGKWPLFRLPQRLSSDVESSPEVRKKLSELAASFRLVGIVGDQELLAIVEDRRTNNIYYIKKGQYLEEILVEDVQRGKVVLKYEGETMELVL